VCLNKEIVMELNERISYAVVATPFGKGYGCFAIRHDKGTKKYVVAFSFCHPADRKIFSKNEARKRALNRLKSFQYVVEVEHDNHEFAEIIKKAAQLSTKTPNWALKALKNGTFYHTLSYDRFSSEELLSK